MCSLNNPTWATINEYSNHSKGKGLRILLERAYFLAKTSIEYQPAAVNSKGKGTGKETMTIRDEILSS